MHMSIRQAFRTSIDYISAFREATSEARLDGRHHIELAETDASLAHLMPDLSLGAEDARDLQSLSGHHPLM